MRTPLLARLCPALSTLLFAAASSAGPLLPDTPVKPVRADAVARAREVLDVRAPASAGLTLLHRETTLRPGGQKLVRFAQQHAGLPVLWRGASVLLDAQGKPTRFSAAHLAERFPSSSQPSVPAAEAAKRGSSWLFGQSFAPSDAKLAWLPRGGDARLVWVLYRGRLPGTPRSPVIVLDADKGTLVLAYDATRFDRAATVYAQNPVSTPTAASVTLQSLAQGATKLEDTRIRSVTCVDTHKLVGKWGIHMCELLPKAAADANGDFPFTFTSDTAVEDEFAEVSMYFHTAKAYAFYESLGMPELEFKPLTTVANLRFPQGWETGNSSKLKDPTLDLEPYDNAFFSPQSPFPGLFQGIDGGLFFGQGKVADFAYDGDVVYHELGHALVDRTVNLVSHWMLDEQGGSPAPGAMNEGLADYFSSALTGDGKVGEYAAKNMGYGGGGKEIRDLANSDTCPKFLAGESHMDSTIFSGALWSVRSTLSDTDKKTFDTALVTAMLGAPSGELGYEALGELFRASVEASALGKTAADALATEFEKRGLFPVCKRVMEYKGQPISSQHWKLANGFFAPGRPYVNLDQTEAYAPGLLQFHTTLKPETDSLKVQWDNYPLGGQYDLGPEAEPYSPALLVRFDKDPITFNYDAGVSANADLVETGAVTGSSVTLDVPAGSTDAWVMIVNKGDNPGLFLGVELLQKTTASGGSGGTSGFGGFGGSGALGGSGGNPASTGGTGGGYDQPLRALGGCSVPSSGRDASGVGALWLALLAVLGRHLTSRRAPRRL